MPLSYHTASLRGKYCVIQRCAKPVNVNSKEPLASLL